ncbi:hypothetical protein Hamer_G021494 [Homarus americanus]|uniref:Uncharacterized protein n=1 Tax=Homarus americanus TaxID=6706 RepID=A0A8J5K1L8_HOMAM|nr:hypothetical protein Hamer_G021494 [Homarus americanus]
MRNHSHQMSQVKSRRILSRRIMSRQVTDGVGPIFFISHAESAVVDVLINLVRERPAIYDPTDRSHLDRDVIAARR